MKNINFGTDGIRGPLGVHPITPETFEKLAQALAVWGGITKVCLAHDTRHSAEHFVSALTQGFQATDCQVLNSGLMPTPALPYLCRHTGAWGCMVTASHNGSNDQGLKLFSPHGTKLSRYDEDNFLNFYATFHPFPSLRRGTLEILSPEKSLAPYKASLPLDPHLYPQKIRLVVDCGQGSYAFLAPCILEALGFQLVCRGITPNGYNINTSGSQHPQTLCQTTRNHQAYGGIAFDGDGDRVLLSDETGKLLCGNTLLAFLAWQGVIKRHIPPRIVLSETVNRGVEELLCKNAITCWRSGVGDRFVGEVMRQHHALLGGEPSGHLLFNDGFSGDGLRAALVCLSYSLQHNLKLSLLFPELKLFHEKQTAIHLEHPPQSEYVTPYQALEKRKLKQNHDSFFYTFSHWLKKLEPPIHEAKAHGVDIMIRPSGTEPVIRLRAEGQDAHVTELFFTVIEEQLTELIRNNNTPLSHTP